MAERDGLELKQDLGLGHFEGGSWLAVSSSRGALRCGVGVPGGRAEPCSPSAQAGKLELAVSEPEEGYQPRGSRERRASA